MRQSDGVCGCVPGSHPGNTRSKSPKKDMAISLIRVRYVMTMRESATEKNMS